MKGDTMNVKYGETAAQDGKTDLRAADLSEAEKAVMEKYGDIINLPHHVSQNRPQMPPSNRAAQFASFAALSGYEEAIDKTARAVNEKEEEQTWDDSGC